MQIITHFDGYRGRYLFHCHKVEPPAPHQYHVVTAIASFLRASTAWHADRRLRQGPQRAMASHRVV
ncbi:hypothetical protein EDD27_4500 [Nonomuraea polychroma]|uniref:Uncharacterized protein n=1 Tax=Nonomuraea polychroma TaxID=46176 RepID=A0A438M849_9ACTN|nr:hypothetical protein [Nonomuraea polychroma]RVX41901.1 hypothetical protein EDD27_4500 [Nonomuraea polychroma]